jgi:hypothetical protein
MDNPLKKKKKEDIVPKSADEEVKLEELDMAYTKSLRYITFQIDTLIKNEENILTSFYNEFVSISKWVMEQTGFLPPDIKDKILMECSRLKDNADKNLKLLNSVKLWTQGQEKTDCKKLMIKVEIEHDFTEQKRLIKMLNFPQDISRLSSEIIGLAESGSRVIQQDIDIQKKTMQLIGEFEGSIMLIRQNLGVIASSIDANKDLQLIKEDLNSLIDKINAELYKFKCLDYMERVHLQLLLSLFKDESESIEKEKMFGEKEAHDTTQDKYIEEDFV